MKTTNSVEGYHNSINLFFLSLHPTIWRFIQKLKEFDEGVWKEVRAWNAGHEPPQSRKWKGVESRKRIAVLRWNDVEAGTLSRREYLAGIAATLN